MRVLFSTECFLYWWCVCRFFFVLSRVAVGVVVCFKCGGDSGCWCVLALYCFGIFGSLVVVICWCRFAVWGNIGFYLSDIVRTEGWVCCVLIQREVC